MMALLPDVMAEVVTLQPHLGNLRSAQMKTPQPPPLRAAQARKGRPLFGPGRFTTCSISMATAYSTATLLSFHMQ